MINVQVERQLDALPDGTQPDDYVGASILVGDLAVGHVQSVDTSDVRMILNLALLETPEAEETYHQAQQAAVAEQDAQQQHETEQAQLESDNQQVAEAHAKQEADAKASVEQAE